MTYLQIYTEVVNLRFNGSATKLAQVKNWVGQAEIAVWNAADWVFKRMTQQSATPSLVGNVARVDLSTPTTALSKVSAVYNNLGDPLVYMRPDEWEETYAVAVPVPSGTPQEAYTIMASSGAPPVVRSLYVGPASTSPITISGRRRYYHLTNAGVATLGVMSVDTDTPCWDSEFHYILVPWAIRLGKLLEDDPTASLDDQALLGLSEMGMLNAMKKELLDTTEDVLAVWSV